MAMARDSNETMNDPYDLPGTGKTVGILGVPLSYGQSMAGVHLGPAAIRALQARRRSS